MNIRTIALAATALAVLASTNASAQTYYARERISTQTAAPAPTPTPLPAGSWSTGDWSSPSSSCSASAAQVRTVACVAEGSTVEDSRCATAKPAATQTVEIYSGCTYTASYGAFGACTNGSQTASITRCVRSGGNTSPVDVSLSMCPSTTTASCTPSSCKPLLAQRAAANGSGLLIGSNILTLDQAQASCEAYAKANPSKSGACDYTPSVKRTYFYTNATALNDFTGSSYITYSNFCNKP